MANTMGPNARANEPSDLKIPKTVPFWLVEPNLEAIVVRQGTTVAEAIK